ncbi:protein BatD [Litorilituus lipolyticus]|uniref:Protein BatD n=2 Tax=Litorilituus lipolyticus TaxID=2491017 RepID=A0A502L402_9GAMM|nr:protein BatD [Litorilituus lipolyticus]
MTLSHSTYALTNVTATVDKNPVMHNESIVLTVIADDDVERNQLDTSPLLKDFIVGQTSVSSQTTMVNFKTSRTTSWQILLIARKTGKLTIPALEIEGNFSQPITLEVLQQSEHDNKNQQDIFITSELSRHEVFVQQLLTLTLKLHFSVELKSGNLTEPELAGATVEKIGQDQQSDTIINGKRYRVIEQTYAITPEKSGTFDLAAPMFSGEVMMPSRRRSNFLSFAETKPVSILGEKMELVVKPIPDSFINQSQNNKQMSWLPSELLSLHQEWQANGQDYMVGEPITRTITLTAAGLSKAQLPVINMKAAKGLKVYPDQAQLHSNLTKERLVSQKVQNFALVASHAGRFILPEIRITWFNTVTNKIEHATLPEQTITVKENPDAPNSNLTNIATTQPAKSSNNEAIAPSLSPSSKQAHLPSSETNNLQWLFLGLWVVTLLAWLIHVSLIKQRKPNTPLAESTHDSGQSYIKLLAACKKGQAQLTLDLIIPWLNHSLKLSGSAQITTIAQAQAVVSEQNFSTALNELQQHLFGKNAISGAPNWQGDMLLSAIQQFNKRQQTPTSTSLQLNP